jgi:transposase
MKSHRCCYFMRRLVLMEVSLLLSLPEGLRVERLEPQGDLLAIAVVSVRPFSCCPLCAQASWQIHSQYQRTLRDVPCGGRKVVLHLSVRKFFCRNPACVRKIFTERLPAFVEPWARVTIRLFEEVQAIGLATSGELGTRLADRIGIHASPTTILRRIMALPSLPSLQVAYLGIDDWSFRRGRKFGTILVDLTSHKILDLLPDRDAQTAAAWMSKHPEIELVSRDRGEEYAAAARLGAPQAIQCADRFHLAQNLTEIAEVILASCRAEIRKAVKTQLPTLPQWPEPHAPAVGSAHLARHAERTDRYQQLLDLRQAGLTLKEIARRLGMGERTVRYWLTRGIPYGKPELRHKRHRRGFDRYVDYVVQRWKQGERNGLQLWRELQAQGYKGSWRTVYRLLAMLRESPAPLRGKAERAQVVPEAPLQDFSAKDAVWLFVRDPADLEETERQDLAVMCQASPTAKMLYELIREFMTMLRHRKGEHLDNWLRSARASHIRELQRFVRSIERDKAAVVAGMTLLHSNGIVEGKVNKLKLIKRMGYGRAGFPLLRQRVLHAL